MLAFYHKVKEQGHHINFAFNHGFVLAFYFPDPELHLIEVYWPNDRKDYQLPYAEQVNLDLPLADRRHLVAAMPDQKQQQPQ